jgi:hypothetical protein
MRWSVWALLSLLLASVPGARGQWNAPAPPPRQANTGLAGDPALAQAGSPGSNYIPEGTRFVALLEGNLESAKLKPGKRFKAKLGEDLTAPNGAVIPRQSKIRGHVSSVDQGLHGRILLAFDFVQTQHGWIPLAATVVDVPGEHGVKTGKEGEIEKAGLTKRRIAEGAAAGAAAGAGTGAVAGGPTGAAIGAATGAAVGGAASALTDRDLKLVKGQQLELQLDRPLEVPLR